MSEYEKENQETQENETQETPAEPPVRKSNADYAKERIEKKEKKEVDQLKEMITQMQEQMKQLAEQSPAQVDNELLKKLASDNHETKLNQEIFNFVSKNPDFAQHEDSIKQWAKHEAYSKVPLEQIARMVAYDSALQNGAKLAQIADQKAAMTKTGGNSTPAPKKEEINAENINQFSDDDILADTLARISR